MDVGWAELGVWSDYHHTDLIVLSGAVRVCACWGGGGGLGVAGNDRVDGRGKERDVSNGQGFLGRFVMSGGFLLVLYF